MLGLWRRGRSLLRPAASLRPASGGGPARARLLLIAPPSSYRTGAYLSASRRLGLEVTVASQGKAPLVSLYTNGLAIDPDDPEAAFQRLLEEHGRRPYGGVVATDDQVVELAARIATRLGLPGNPPEASRYSRRKDLARTRLAAAGLPVPAHERLAIEAIEAGALPACGFPVVLKPLSLSGSRGVIRADEAEGFRAAARRIQRIVARAADPETRRSVLVERYVPGWEFALEGLLTEGRLEVLALFDKPDPLEGPYFEETYYITPARIDEGARDRIRETVAAACAAYGLVHGPVHAELRLDPAGTPWILEVASRTIGGQCGQLLRFGTGYGLEELVAAHAVGSPLPVRPPRAAAGVLMIPTPRAGILRRVEGVLAAARLPGVEDVHIAKREGDRLVPLPEGDSYLGFIFARGPDPDQVEAALRAAHARLRVVTAPERLRVAPA